MSVWILVIYMGGYNSGGPMFIDNIASQAECQRVSEILYKFPQSILQQCIEVRKAK